MSKVVYLKNGQVYVADEGGANVRKLTENSSSKRTPRWSPDGRRILYWSVGGGKGFLAKLVVIKANNGAATGSYPVATVTSAGVPIEGMREIERVGWSDDEDIFAQGEVNPYVAEYRKINLRTGAARSFGGFGFSSCPARAIVAFWLPFYPQQTVSKLVTSNDQARSLFDIPGANDLPTLKLPITWNHSCDLLAFIDTRPPERLVVISIPTGDRKAISLSSSSTPHPIDAWKQGFLVGAKAQWFYLPGSTSLKETPNSLAIALEKARNLRFSTAKVLEASDPDWWPQEPIE